MTRLTRPRAVLETLFDAVIRRGKYLKDYKSAEDSKLPCVFNDFVTWDREARLLLVGAFTDMKPLDFIYPKQSIDRDASWEWDDIQAGIDARVLALESIRELLPLYSEPSESQGSPP